MGLTEYWRKRDFNSTAEPHGGRVLHGSSFSFVVQKHAASSLHYDFRLELDGVLKSWAVPKGPSLYPKTKRLAIHVEDHPLEYGRFEGIIPKGEYGGGTVMLWDIGKWEPIGDATNGYREGSLKFILHGEKLQGRWMLVRKSGKRGGVRESHWFLFKEKDEFARPNDNVTEDLPLSVATGRNLDEITGQAKRVWNRNGEVKKSGITKRSVKKVAPTTKKNSLPAKKTTVAAATGIAKALKHTKAKKAPIPASPSVKLATLTKEAPRGEEWIHEIKFDGYRMLCRVDDGEVRFISRNGKDWTSKFPTLVMAIKRLKFKNAILDGEVVVLQPDGTTSFQALQNAFQSPNGTPFQFYVFDLLYFDGHDLRTIPIEDRKSVLRDVIPHDPKSPMKFSEHVIGNGPEFFSEASRLGLEGIISKRLGRPYSAGRGLDWLKIKSSLREEFVIGGFTVPSGSRNYFGALAIGYFDGHRQLKYAGRVGTGFDNRTLETLHHKLSKIVQKASPFIDLLGTSGEARGVTWVKPSLVAQIEFSNWTNEMQLRHPAFQGLREDKSAKDVIRDEPISHNNGKSPEKAELHKKKVATGRNRTKANSAMQTTREGIDFATVRLSHPDKILYPDDQITKLDLAKYYEQVFSWMLPHVENRLLSLVRCPNGSGKKCFFQKHPVGGTTEHLRRVEVVEKGSTLDYVALYDLRGLISLVQMGVLEIHLGGSKADRFEKPDRLIFDLDPDPTVEWPQLVVAAKEVRLLLEQLELTSFLKTTGGKGLHVVVPIRRRTTWDDAKAFCRFVADYLVAAAPDRYVATMSKAARKGKIFIDYLRNDRGATSIAPYSTRARPGATVSVPIRWDELSNRLKSDHFNIKNLPARLSKLKKDPWAEIDTTDQGITASMLRMIKSR